MLRRNYISSAASQKYSIFFFQCMFVNVIFHQSPGFYMFYLWIKYFRHEVLNHLFIIFLGHGHIFYIYIQICIHIYIYIYTHTRLSKSNFPNSVGCFGNYIDYKDMKFDSTHFLLYAHEPLYEYVLLRDLLCGRGRYYTVLHKNRVLKTVTLLQLWARTQMSSTCPVTILL